MIKEEYITRRAEYEKAMPQWMKDNFNKDIILFHIVEKCFYSDIPANELVNKVAEYLFNYLVKLQRMEIQKQIINSQLVICPQ